jgi:hypothetical protein
MTDPELRETYLQALVDCAVLSAADNFLSLEIDRLVGVIFDAATADPKKQWASDSGRLNDAVEFIRTFAASRPAQVLAEVAQIRKTAR